jgi:hypothetical protein
MRIREKIALVLALTHLVLVCLGGAQVPLWNYGALGRWLHTYGLYTGSGSRYSFFAPGVGYGYRTEFDIYDSKENLIATEGMYIAATREGNLRVANLIQLMSNNLEDPEKRKEISGSLVGKVFARHPNAARVALRLDSIDIPLMRDYRNGARYSWEPVYRAQFSHKGRLSDG